MDDAEGGDGGPEQTVQFEERMVRYDPAPQFPQSCGFGDYRDRSRFSVTYQQNIKDRVSALEQLPHSEQIINAVISAFIITFLRPPTDTA
jgi:hypothetical protein